MPLTKVAAELGATAADLLADLTGRGVPVMVPGYAVAELMIERSAQREEQAQLRAEAEAASADEHQRREFRRRLRDAETEADCAKAAWKYENYLLENDKVGATADAVAEAESRYLEAKRVLDELTEAVAATAAGGGVS